MTAKTLRFLTPVKSLNAGTLGALVCGFAFGGGIAGCGPGDLGSDPVGFGGRAAGSGGVGSTSGGAALSEGGHTASNGQGAAAATGPTGGALNTQGGVAGSTGGAVEQGGSEAGAGRSQGGSAGTSVNAGKGGTSSESTGGSTTTARGGRGNAGAASGGAPGSGGSNNNGGSANPGGLLVPDSGALLGLYYGADSLSATETKLGRSIPLHLTYYAWDDDFTQAETAKDLAAGRIPFVNWELFGGELDDIIGGKYDDMIQQRAEDTKALGEPLFIDFGAEMNGDWSPWGGAQNGKSPDKYLAVYRKVHDAFTDAGASNVVWAFCPNVTDEPRESWNQALGYYPGDDYVDWMCVDGYNWGNTDGEAWQSFEQVFKEIYPKLASKNKPIMIGEMASAESGGDKAAWIDAMVPTLKNKYPAIRGLIWFDIDKETDWRVSSSPESEAAFKRMANDAYFNP